MITTDSKVEIAIAGILKFHQKSPKGYFLGPSTMTWAFSPVFLELAGVSRSELPFRNNWLGRFFDSILFSSKAHTPGIHMYVGTKIGCLRHLGSSTASLFHFIFIEFIFV